jgi:Putative Ig domain
MSFVHDMITGMTARASVASDGTQGNDRSYVPTLSSDGRYIVFNSDATNLVVGDTNGRTDVFLTLNPLAPHNQAPVLNPIGNKSVNEGQTLSFTLSATDPDTGDTLTYSATNTPPGSTFDPATRTFSWTPDYTQAGNYPDVEFMVTDNGSPMMLDLEDITITVGDVNRAPVLSNPGPQQVLEHATTTFTVSATDPDGNAVTLSASGMPSGATFNTSTGVFSWTPGYPTAGVYTPTFIATDNGSPVASSSVDVVITVGSNPTPSEQDQTLTNTVVSYNLPSNITNQYLQNLDKAAQFIQSGRANKAISELNNFISKVNNDYSHGNITLAEKNQMVTMAQALINALQ